MWGRTHGRLGVASIAAMLVVVAVVAGQHLQGPGSAPTPGAIVIGPAESAATPATIVVGPAVSAMPVDEAGVSQSGTWWASRPGMVFVSSDQGEHWIQPPLPVPSATAIVVDASNIWALGRGADKRWSAYRTRDGGSTWRSSTIGSADPGRVANFVYDFVYTDLDRAEILITTDATGSSAEVWRTTDAGASWDPAGQITCPARCTGIIASDMSTFWLLTGEGYERSLLVSRDAGSTWSRAEPPLAGYIISDFRFFTADSGTVAYVQECPAGECANVTFVVTADGGRTWSTVEAPNTYWPAIDAPNAWSVVTTNNTSYGGDAPPTPLPPDGKLLVTTDGGRTWTERSYVEPDTHPRYRPHLIGTHGYWLRRAEGGDVLYVTSDGGASWSVARLP
jgi:photosystem II stability/assembly factor-like uncharacterized protein